MSRVVETNLDTVSRFCFLLSLFLPYCLQSPVSSLQSPVSSLQSPVSSLQSPVSSLQSPVSSLQSPVSSLQSPPRYRVLPILSDKFKSTIATVFETKQTHLSTGSQSTQYGVVCRPLALSSYKLCF